MPWEIPASLATLLVVNPPSPRSAMTLHAARTIRWRVSAPLSSLTVPTAMAGEYNVLDQALGQSLDSAGLGGRLLAGRGSNEALGDRARLGVGARAHGVWRGDPGRRPDRFAGSGKRGAERPAEPGPEHARGGGRRVQPRLRPGQRLPAVRGP